MNDSSEESEAAPIATTSRVPPEETESNTKSDSAPITTATRAPELD
ncbi:hypothetical protein [Halobellus clavatus]|jgi:hypothetical protein|uniref:Uncharacterized protein n=1 Tax=Halobellus clavatus TaxID=660517 RepID=A0A1H3JSY7_9EURY|nr:hypothetical protein [Halobellus clavatus]SDY43036.1 hypothetical protein SAMN04487946_11538 [Halobellus clavatus]